jgi:hypothetical protein
MTMSKLPEIDPQLHESFEHYCRRVRRLPLKEGIEDSLRRTLAELNSGASTQNVSIKAGHGVSNSANTYIDQRQLNILSGNVFNAVVRLAIKLGLDDPTFWKGVAWGFFACAALTLGWINVLQWRG